MRYMRRQIAQIFLSTPSARRATSDAPCTQLRRIEFLSTPSARRATLLGIGLDEQIRISIHALREEGDQCHRLTR